MDADEARPSPEPPDEPANPYAEEDDTGTPLTHSELLRFALESLAEHHLEYLKQAAGERHPLRQWMAAVDFWTDLRRNIRLEVDARPNLAPDAWLDALSDEAKAGVPLDEANARLVERGDAIYGELVDGRGPEARDAWVDALERFDYLFRVLEARAAAGTL